MPLALNKARVSMYVNDLTLYMSATTETERTATPMHTPRDMPQEVSSQSSSPEQTMGGTRYYIES
jgi:hypothetical protein